MNDFNFFSSFEKEKQAQRKKNRRNKGIIYGIIGIIILFYGVLGGKLLYYNMAIKSGNDFLNAPENNAKIAELQSKKAATLDLRQYNLVLDQASAKIHTSNLVNSGFMNTLQKAFPATVSLRYLSMKDNQLLIEGDAPLWTQTAELTHNLDASGLFTRVHVNTITKNKDAATYYFSISCDMKEVAVQ